MLGLGINDPDQSKAEEASALDEKVAKIDPEPPPLKPPTPPVLAPPTPEKSSSKLNPTVAALLGFVLALVVSVIVYIGWPIIASRILGKSQIDGVRHATLKIESRIATGVNRVEYPQILSELAYELLLARDLSLNASDAAAVKKYGEAFESYMVAKDVWEANQDYKGCLKEFRYDEQFCLGLHSAAMKAAASKAHVSPEVVAGDNAVQTVWHVAEQQVQEAEKTRLGLTSSTEARTKN